MEGIVYVSLEISLKGQVKSSDCKIVRGSRVYSISRISTKFQVSDPGLSLDVEGFCGFDFVS